MILGLASDLIGTLYPSYATLKVLRHGANDPQYAEKVPKWLAFWAIRSSWSLLNYTGIVYLVGSTQYYFFSIILYLWLLLPQFQGSLKLYSMVIEPFLEKHEAAIDQGIAKYSGEAKQLAATFAWKLFVVVKQVAVDLMVKAHQSILQQQFQQQQQQQQQPAYQPPMPPHQEQQDQNAALDNNGPSARRRSSRRRNDWEYVE
eukprot:TRINITY_DN1489_c0_g1_i2.p1 TRINITY_DN1489_c0_g1~~TRINITY_DN1489_c0_g1_i2.p1  ORF type:complete len:202 (+),score=52.86 TRINITY_DN1489_c0_g1_i2:39-644(+)